MTPVVVLCASSVPNAIVGRISSFVVDTFKRVFAAWSRTHVGKKQNEIAPSITHCDPACTVVGETFDVRIVAPLEHPGPNAVFWDALLSRGLSMFEVSISRRCFVKASARSRSPGSYASTWKQCFLSTITDDFPQRWNVLFDCKQTESLSRDINQMWHPAIVR